MTTIAKYASGVYHGIPDNVYHSQKWAVSSSFLKTMFTDNPHVARYWDTHTREDTAAFQFGRAFHTVMTGVGQQPVLKTDVPTVESTKIDGKVDPGLKAERERLRDMAAAQKESATAGDVLIMSEKDMEALGAMKANLEANPVTAGLLASSQPEVSMFWQDEATGVWCRIRPDLMDIERHIVTDLKSVGGMAGAGHNAFAKSTANLAYDIQAAFYRRGYRETFGVTPAFLFAAVEKSEPYQVGIYELDDRTIDRAEAVVEDLLTEYSIYSTFNEWPGIPADIQPLTLPGWADHAREEYLDETR